MWKLVPASGTGEGAPDAAVAPVGLGTAGPLPVRRGACARPRACRRGASLGLAPAGLACPMELRVLVALGVRPQRSLRISLEDRRSQLLLNLVGHLFEHVWDVSGCCRLESCFEIPELNSEAATSETVFNYCVDVLRPGC